MQDRWGERGKEKKIIENWGAGKKSEERIREGIAEGKGAY